MLQDTLFVLWFFLPSGIANMVPILAAKTPWLQNFNQPLDFNKSLRGRRILGDHKTIRGLVSGTLAAILTVWLQIAAYNHAPIIRSFSEINYNTINPVLLGSLAALGALGGDAIKSFFKRGKNFPPGHTWFPFDQIDYIVGGIIATAFYIRLSLTQYMMLLIVWFLLHPISTIIGYLLKLKDKPI